MSGVRARDSERPACGARVARPACGARLIKWSAACAHNPHINHRPTTFALDASRSSYSAVHTAMFEYDRYALEHTMASKCLPAAVYECAGAARSRDASTANTEGHLSACVRAHNKELTHRTSHTQRFSRTRTRARKQTCALSHKRTSSTREPRAVLVFRNLSHKYG